MRTVLAKGNKSRLVFLHSLSKTISLSKIVDNEKINIKLDLNALGAKLPSIEKDICITLIATKSPRKADNWEKDGKEYYNVILNHNRVLYSTSQYVLKLILKECVAVLDKT